MEVNHNTEIENHSGDGGNWSDSIATEFTDENWCDMTFKKEPTDLIKESVTPMLIFEQEQQQLQHSIPYQQFMHTLKGPTTVDQQNQILHLLKNNPSLMSTFKKQKQQQSRMNGAIEPMGPSQIQQLPNLQHMYPQQLQHHQQQQPQPGEDHRVQEQQFQGHSRVAPGVQFPQQYGVVGGPAGQNVVESTSVVHSRAYDQLIDSLKRATSVAQQKKILHTLRSNPSLMDVYLNKCKQENEQPDERVDTLNHNQSNQQQPMQPVLSQQQQYHQFQPAMGINGQMPPAGLNCKENISTLHDEAYQQLVPTLKSPHSPNQKQQVLRNIKSNPATMAALRRHRQKQAVQNSGGSGSLVPSQLQNQESSLHLIVPQQPIQQQQMQQQEQFRNQVYQQLPQHHQSQIHQEPPIKIEPINQIDSENAKLKLSAAYQKLTEILKSPNTPERQNHILHLVRCNPLLRSAFAKKRQSQVIEQQSGISVAQNEPLQQPRMQHVLPQQEQYQINQQLQQQQSAQGPSLQQNQLHWYTQQQHQQEQEYGNMAALNHTPSPEKINQIIRDLQSKPELISDFAEQRQHEGEVRPLHSIQQQQQQMQHILFQQQNQQNQQQYSLGPNVQQYQHEALTQTSPPSHEQQSRNSSSSLNYGGFEQDYGQASWNPTSPMQQLKQLVETPSSVFSSQSIPSPQSVPSPINHSVPSSEGGPGPSPHYQPHHPSHEDQNYSLDHELYVPSGILSLESYPVNCNDTSEMLKITPQDLFDFVNKL